MKKSMIILMFIISIMSLGSMESRFGVKIDDIQKEYDNDKLISQVMYISENYGFCIVETEYKKDEDALEYFKVILPKNSMEILDYNKENENYENMTLYSGRDAWITAIRNGKNVYLAMVEGGKTGLKTGNAYTEENNLISKYAFEIMKKVLESRIKEMEIILMDPKH